ncbi:Atxe2 family lasso peptide isopeptidase [Sphingomonas sp. AP4-R1]|uniref:Atxe2 family lasso peptide isopeptidase n=1 Tax=Sphingomonas sp. AP4-R1 TaxID=2735134 RepID=UPI00149376FB|nr:Atxe2 family lasso peptide isopeptidase [Sphingomonas sp. AP4-R1]QJU58446.1 Atxe2 family lasso peptide isopeptidase [Sphingomonas sp. AP4-R1]
MALALICGSAPCISAGSQKPASSTHPDSPAARPLTAADLVQLTDIGPTYPEPGQHVFSVSPDGKKVAFQIRRADPSSNQYEIEIVVANIYDDSPPKTIDAGGGFIPQIVRGIGGATVSTGYAASAPIIWSADAKSVYFLKKPAGKVQVWRSASDGSQTECLTSEAQDVENFAISADGRRVIFSTGSTETAQERSRRDEALRGYRYDERFIPLFANGPEAFRTDTIVVRSLELATGVVDRATGADVDALGAGGAAGSSSVVTSPQGRAASVQRGSVPGWSEPSQILVRDRGNRTSRCAEEACSGATLIWWVKGGQRLRYLRREGWGRGELAIYEWQPGRGSPRRLYLTADLLVECQALGDNLICAREQSRVPRHLVMLNPGTGDARVIYNPNPTFGGLALGQVERLNWRNAFGVETFGDLVYPVGYVRGTTYPLIVVQYTSRGFLRGGVGDEFPIQAFANRGYAVLSVQRPDARNLVPRSATMADYERHLLAGFTDRRSVLSSIEVAVQVLTRRGIVDPGRIGLTGLSDGSSTVQFAAINSTAFKAASVSGCCWEPFQDAFVGPGASQAFHEIGWPRLIDYNAQFWSRMSLIQNAKQITMPLLMQQSDDEFRAAVSSYTALKQAGRPVSLFVFPDEHHVKWQPAHRLAAYERNLRWFDYWLKGVGGGQEWGIEN